jgi:hypothetical protein
VRVLTRRLYSRVESVDGIIYLHKISDNRITVPPASTVAVLGRFCGEDASSRILLMTTMWDDVDPEVSAVREAEIKTRYWSNMLSTGSRIIRFDKTVDSVWTAVNAIIRKQPIVIVYVLFYLMYTRLILYHRIYSVVGPSGAGKSFVCQVCLQLMYRLTDKSS